jgi:hypothetical protein
MRPHQLPMSHREYRGRSNNVPPEQREPHQSYLGLGDNEKLPPGLPYMQENDENWSTNVNHLLASVKTIRHVKSC